MQGLTHFENPIQTARPPAHSRLRDATRAAHARAESVPVLASLLSGNIDAERYGAMLASLAALFERWEAAHWRFLTEDVPRAGWRYASRYASLVADLEDLGHAERRRTTGAPLHARGAERWGMLYVVEGAALGGRVLAESARRAMAGHAPTRYLDIAGTRERTWRDCCAMLDRVLAGPHAVAAAIGGAERMFAAYELALRDA
ncbi:MAG TPA: biliverdin-producing heme oxygenase [Rhodanobacteraceae bacterium]